MAIRAMTHQRHPKRIVRDPRILGGEPTIRGTRVPVRAVVLTHHICSDIVRLMQAFPMLTPADIEEALAFYQTNREEIDRYIAENEQDAEA